MRRARGWVRTLFVLPGVIAAADLGFLVAHVSRLVGPTSWNSDDVGPLVIADRIARSVRPGVTHATEPAFITLNAALAHLPGRMALWQSLAPVLAAVTVSLIVWSTWRIGGWRAGVLSVALLVPVSDVVLHSYVAQNLHGTTWVGIAVCASLLTYLTPKRVLTARTLVVCSVAAVVLGWLAASDLLLFVAGVAPLGIAGVVLVARERSVRHPSVPGVIAVSASLLIALLSIVGRRLNALQHIVLPRSPIDRPVGFAPVGEMRSNVKLWFEGVANAFNVWTGGHVSDRTIILGVIVALAVATTVVVAIRMAIGIAAQRVPVASVLVVFWLASAALVSIAFVTSDIPVDLGSSRYLVPLVFAVAGTLPLVATRAGAGRWIACALAASVVVTSLVATRTVQHTYEEARFRPPSSYELPVLIRALERRGLGRGYADYWDANAISWHAHDRVQVLPVIQGGLCEPDHAGGLCPLWHNVSEGVFRPARGRSFVVADPVRTVQAEPPREVFGAAEESFHVDRFTVYVYGYDVVRKMGRAISF